MLQNTLLVFVVRFFNYCSFEVISTQKPIFSPVQVLLSVVYKEIPIHIYTTQRMLRTPWKNISDTLACTYAPIELIQPAYEAYPTRHLVTEKIHFTAWVHAVGKQKNNSIKTVLKQIFMLVFFKFHLEIILHALQTAALVSLSSVNNLHGHRIYFKVGGIAWDKVPPPGGCCKCTVFK